MTFMSCPNCGNICPEGMDECPGCKKGKVQAKAMTKRERRRGREFATVCGGIQPVFDWIEVFDDDPADLDEALDAARGFEAGKLRNETDIANAIDRLRKALEPKQ